MKLTIISGRSGSGKTTALQAMEDQNYYCVDNLPVGILALGARERGAFHPGQGSDLVNFLARVAELSLRRWLPRG